MCSIENITVLNLGQFEEENARTVKIDVSKWLLPDTTFSIIVRRPTETEDYFAENVIVDEDGILTWTPSLYDMSIQGSGQVTIVRFGNNNIKKTGIIRTIINSSLPTGASPVHPQPVPSWLTEVLEKADEILDGRVVHFEINAEGHLIATLEDGTTQDLGNISGVSSVNGKTGVVTLSAEDVGALPNDTVIPSKTSDLTNDSGFITNVDLTGYATKTWVNALLSGKADKVNVTSADAGKFMRVNSQGEWEAETVPNANGVSF